jgi:3-hydroxyacyl-[acyl-carrier-protein] dehydratase
LNRQELMEILPHRDEMLLIDEAEKTDATHTTGSYTVRGDEWFIRGHYPGNPVVPGVILCEMIAQTCCVIILTKENTAVPYFTGIDKARFKNKVQPGDTIRFACTLTKVRLPFYFAHGEGTVDGKVCVSGDFSFALIGNE